MIVYVAYDSRLLDWRLSEGHPSNPIRAKLSVEMLQARSELDVHVEGVRHATLAEMLLVHDREYIDDVVRLGLSSEWAGCRRDLADTARLMMGGTMRLVDRLIAGECEIAFAPQGFKHHSHRDYSSGFCVFNDAAAAALRFADAGERVAYVDVDAHHGDGVEEILRSRSDIWTMSIHDGTIFPGTGFDHESENGVFNWPLRRGSGDDALEWSMDQVEGLLQVFEPTVLLFACGADGLANDPLTSLEYTEGGLVKAAGRVAKYGQKILIGGSGGYLALDETPSAWAAMVAEIVRVRQLVHA